MIFQCFTSWELEFFFQGNNGNENLSSAPKRGATTQERNGRLPSLPLILPIGSDKSDPPDHQQHPSLYQSVAAACSHRTITSQKSNTLNIHGFQTTTKSRPCTRVQAFAPCQDGVRFHEQDCEENGLTCSHLQPGSVCNMGVHCSSKRHASCP